MITPGDDTPRQQATSAEPIVQPSVDELIEVLAIRGLDAVDIERRVRPYATRRGERMPSLRTIQRRVRDLRGRDPSGRWTLADEDAALVLPVLAAVISATGSRVQELTRAEAEWIARVRKAAPDLDPWLAYLVAREYLRRQTAKEGAGDLDAFLGFAPWRSNEAAQRYLDAQLNGVSPPPWEIKLGAELWASGITTPYINDLLQAVKGEIGGGK